MSATEMIYKIIDEKCLKQSAVARASGFFVSRWIYVFSGNERMVIGCHPV